MARAKSPSAVKKTVFKAPGEDEHQRLRWYARYPVGFLLPHFIVLLANLWMKQFPRLAGFMVIGLLFVVLPLIDYLWPLDQTNPSREEARQLNKMKSFAVVTWVWLPLELFMLYRGTARLIESWDSMSWPVFVSYTFTLGIGTGALGITIAHELIHKASKFEQFLGRVLLVLTCYGHWAKEHLDGHHKMVATPEDPATSRRNQSFYTFFFQTVIGTLKSAWLLQEKDMKKRNIARFSLQWFLRNEILASWASSALVAALMNHKFGVKGVIVFLMSSFFGILLLELVNYVEHYGLRRKEIGKGRFESVTPAHSWNTAHCFSNFILFKLQRHSDHHAHGGRRYQILRSFPNSPQMPNGYPLMVAVALIPPLWFWMMNERLDAYNAQLEEWEKAGYSMSDLFPGASIQNAAKITENQ